MNCRLFCSSTRNEFNYTFARRQMARLIREGTAGLPPNPRILVAPLGSGLDLPFLLPLSNDLAGIDISPEAVASVANDQIRKFVGDMKRMTMFGDASFDAVVTPLFYHHFLGFGFDEFLGETFRVLRPGGHLFSLEPSSLHPVHWLTWAGRKVFGNISGTLADEAPFVPHRLASAMRRCGFRQVRVQAASYTHHRIPIWLARINNAATYPLLKCPGIQHFGWLCFFSGHKPQAE